MKFFSLVLLLPVFVALLGCTTVSTSTVWGDEYLPETSWREYSFFVPLGELPLLAQTSDGRIQTARVDALIYPQLNAYSVYMSPVLFEWQFYLFERDFPALRGIFTKFDEWKQQATDMDVSLNREIGRLLLPVSLKWSGRDDWIAALPEALFFFHTIQSEEIRYVLLLEFPSIEFFEDQPGYNPPISDLRLMFHPATIAEINDMLSDAGVAASLSIVDEYLQQKADAAAATRAAEEEQRRIEETFD